jgi:hypothetical protein
VRLKKRTDVTITVKETGLLLRSRGQLRRGMTGTAVDRIRGLGNTRFRRRGTGKVVVIEGVWGTFVMGETIRLHGKATGTQTGRTYGREKGHGSRGIVNVDGQRLGDGVWGEVTSR